MYCKGGYRVDFCGGKFLITDNMRSVDGEPIYGPLYEEDVLFCESIGKRFGVGKKILEIGTFMGLSTFSMFEGSGKTAEITCIDSWSSDGMIIDRSLNTQVFCRFSQAIDRVGYGKIFPIKAKSKDALPFVKDNYFDIAFIDGDHSYEGAKIDILGCMEKVHSGGVIFGHDYNVLSVKSAVDELLGGVEVNNMMWLKIL